MYLSKVQRNISTFGLGLIALSTAAALSACSDSEKMAGGGPSGTDAGNAITAQLVSAGKPAAQVTVRLTETESINPDSAYIASTDSKGVITFENIADGEYIFEAVMGDKALQKEVLVKGEDVDLGKDSLTKTVSISGSVQEKSGKVMVRGMAHEASVVDGKFTLDSLPAGPLSLVFIPKKGGDTSSTYMKVIAGENSTASTFAEESRSLLLDDFQDSNYQNRFMPAQFYEGGWWYFDYSEENVTPKFITDDVWHRFTLVTEKDGNIAAHV
jgi:hypothetical protein